MSHRRTLNPGHPIRFWAASLPLQLLGASLENDELNDRLDSIADIIEPEDGEGDEDADDELAARR